MKSIYILSYMSWCSWSAHSEDCGKGPMEVETSAKPKPCKGNDKTHPLALEGSAWFRQASALMQSNCWRNTSSKTRWQAGKWRPQQPHPVVSDVSIDPAVSGDQPSCHRTNSVHHMFVMNGPMTSSLVLGCNGTEQSTSSSEEFTANSMKAKRHRCHSYASLAPQVK